jgi:branched-chain amino acid transport system permease protein/neutral amino acid transport system permease protein
MTDQFLQFFFNGLVTGGILALPSIAFSLLYGILRFSNFAIGSMITIGGFIAFSANVTLGMPMVAAFLISMGLSGFVGVAVDHLAFRPMRGRRPLTLAIVSIGVSFILENIARFIWGNDLRSFQLPVARAIRWAGVLMGKEQIVILGVSVASMLTVHLLLRQTRLGKTMRAVADNPVLASVKGIDSEQVIRRTTFLGAALAGASGVMVGIDTTIEPLMGFKLILSIFAAAILGGIGSASAAMGGALFVGLAEELSMMWLPPTYKSAIGFSLIVLVLLFRPGGLFQKARTI